MPRIGPSVLFRDAILGAVIAVVTRDSEPPEGSALVRALRAAGWGTEVWTRADAERDPGFPVGAQLVVLEGAPGSAPLLENEAFRESILLYAHAEGDVGTVGPATTPGAAPCPGCLASPTDSPVPDPTVARWVTASTMMEIETLHRHGEATLFGKSLSWSIGHEPGLSSTNHSRRAGCRVEGCGLSRADAAPPGPPRRTS